MEYLRFILYLLAICDTLVLRLAIAGFVALYCDAELLPLHAGGEPDTARNRRYPAHYEYAVMQFTALPLLCPPNTLPSLNLLTV